MHSRLLEVTFYLGLISIMESLFFVRMACNLNFPSIYTHLKSHIAHKNRMVKLIDMTQGAPHMTQGTSHDFTTCSL